MNIENNIHYSISNNKKTGKMLVTTTSSDSCPSTCKHLQLGTCYAKTGPLNLHWKHVDSGKRAMLFIDLLQTVRDLRPQELWRHNQAGDLPGTSEKLNHGAVKALAEASRGKRGFTYTHKYHSEENRKTILDANQDGFTINLSADSIEEAYKLHKEGFPVVVTIVPKDVIDPKYITVCPQQTHENITCLSCGLCAKKDRKTIIGFLAHGVRKNIWIKQA
jgi:hypothetical protein